MEYISRMNILSLLQVIVMLRFNSSGGWTAHCFPSVILGENQLDNDIEWERSGSVVECLTRDRGVAGSSLTGVTVLCP